MSQSKKFTFKERVKSQYRTRLQATAPIKEVDAYIFCTSSKYLGERLFAWQSLAIKIIYGLWIKYPITEKEQEVIDLLKEEWHIDFDLAKRDPGRFIEILILVLGRRSGKCLKEGSLVIDPKTGERVPIEDLYKGGIARVLTLKDNLKIKKGFTTEVHDNGIKPCYKLTTRTGRNISATGNHPFKTLHGWKNLEDLKVGERIAVPRKLDIRGTEILPDNEVRLLGFFIGDGHTVAKCDFTNIIPEVCETFDCDIKEMSPDLEIRHYGINRSVVQPTLTRVIDRTIIQKFVELHGLRGKHSWEKVVPATIFKSTNRQVAIFLSAIYACDGWVDKKSIGYSSTSKQLIQEMQHLLLRFGINATIRTRLEPFYRDENGEKVICRPAYRLEIVSTEDIRTFADEIGIIGKNTKLKGLVARKGSRIYYNTQAQSIPKDIWENIKPKVKEKGIKVHSTFNGRSLYRSGQYSPNRNMVKEFGEVLNDEYLKNLGNSDVYWEPIKSIEYDGDHRTYDLTIDDTHNFICNDIVTHNSSCISFIQTYEAYKLICKGDPQLYYNVRNRNPIWIVNTAKGGDQAQDPFRLCKDNIRKIPFFEKYVDWTKNNESELRLFTPADLYENDKIRQYNNSRSKGMLKKDMLEGSIMVVAFTTSAASKRGKAIICLILDEFAHFDRAKTIGGGDIEEDIQSEKSQTDYAMLKALSPSTKDFIIPNRNIYDGRIIMISSPREKGGEFYRHYCLAGGWEQTNPHREDVNPNYFLLQLSSWQCNPKYSREVFKSDFAKDPVGANMEYGGHFGEPSTSFIDATKIDAMVDEERMMRYDGEWQLQYIISLDPASKGDTYAVTWGHAEGATIIVDGIQGFRPSIVTNQLTNQILKVPVQAEKVVDFVIALAQRLDAHGTLLEVVFDQWNAQLSTTKLKKAGIVAVETFFTNKYKNEMYTNFLEKLNTGALKMCGLPPPNQPTDFPPYKLGWLEQTKLELKYLTKTISADTVRYGAPTSGPIQSDDFADSLANLVHRHVLYSSGDRQVYKDLFKQTGKPIKRPTTMHGIRTQGFFRIPGRGNTPGAIRQSLGDRIGKR